MDSLLWVFAHKMFSAAGIQKNNNFLQVPCPDIFERYFIVKKNKALWPAWPIWIKVVIDILKNKIYIELSRKQICLKVHAQGSI